MKDSYAILVVWKDGTEEYLKEGILSDCPVIFLSKKAATEQAEFMYAGMEDKVQSINVVRRTHERTGPGWNRRSLR